MPHPSLTGASLSWVQFVPQDRVSEFARLKPEELLAATQKAIGNAALYNLHQELIESRKHLSTEEGVGLRASLAPVVSLELPSR